MKRTICAVTAAAFLGTATLTPTPASALVFVLLPFVLPMKYDPNFEAKKAKEAKKMKVTKKSSKKMR